jgi:hypothetical protein
MAPNPDIEHFSRLIDTLRPWLDQVVIIGGWAHRLYRLHPLAQPLGYPLGRDLPNNPSLATPSTAA